MPTYLIEAADCPTIPTPTTGAQDPSLGTPLVADAMLLNQSTGATAKYNSHLVEMEMIGRHGGGLYAIGRGMGLSIGIGLNVTVAAGHAVIDGPVLLTAATDVAVSDAITDGTIWLTQAGALSASTGLTPPAGNVCFLGFYTSAGGLVTAVDESGTIRLEQGNLPVRRTSDTGCPADTPPATVRFIAICTGGAFLWTGTEYANLTGTGRAALTFASDANKTLSAAEACNRYLDLGTGTALTATRNLVVPLTPAGRHWTCRNGTNGGQSVTVIGASGTGVTIANGMRAEVMSSGTDILRVTPDT